MQSNNNVTGNDYDRLIDELSDKYFNKFGEPLPEAFEVVLVNDPSNPKNIAEAISKSINADVPMPECEGVWTSKEEAVKRDAAVRSFRKNVLGYDK